MSYSFEYIDIILLAMIAGFIFLRLRGILGKRTGFDEKLSTDFNQDFSNEAIKEKLENQVFDDNAQKDFLKGAKIAYERIITDYEKVVDHYEKTEYVTYNTTLFEIDEYEIEVLGDFEFTSLKNGLRKMHRSIIN